MWHVARLLDGTTYTLPLPLCSLSYKVVSPFQLRYLYMKRLLMKQLTNHSLVLHRWLNLKVIAIRGCQFVVINSVEQENQMESYHS